MASQYIYIVQASLEPTKCKIGKTDNLERKLKEYNSMTGKSKDNVYQYLFTCEVKDMTVFERDIKKQFISYREDTSREIYFHNKSFFSEYINFIKSHKMFLKEIFIKKEEKKQITKIVKKTTPSLEERGISQINIINKAKNVKNDEFYTRYEDVEKELTMYDKKIWKNKVIFCNCDDPVDDENKNTSAFAAYFLVNFKELGIKKLICTHYGGGIDLFNQGAKGYIFTRNGFREFDYPKGYTGSFDEPLSLKILNEEADIVCTNPPFSMAREYWNIVVNSGKKFIIISNITNPITTAFIPYFKNNLVWAGYNEVDEYLNYKKEIVRAAGYWYTNIPIKNRPKHKLLKIVPLKEIPKEHKKYDDNKILVVDKGYIPNDYKKPFAVSTRPILNGLLEKGYKIIKDTPYKPYKNEKENFARVLVQKIETDE